MATLVLVGVVAGCSEAADDEDRTPVAGESASTATPPEPAGAAAEAVIEARGAHVSSWSVDGDRAVLGIWARGWAVRSPEALAVHARDGREVLSRSPAGVTTRVVADLPHGWLVDVSDHGEDGIARVGQDATTHPLGVSGPEVAPRAGDVAVTVGNRLLVYRPEDDALHVVPPPPMRRWTGALVTPDGALLVAGGDAGAARWARFDHGRWSRGRWQTGVSVAAVGDSGDHLAVALGGPTANGVDSTPVAGLVVSDDAGRTWRAVDVPEHLDETLGVAVTDDGTVFVSTGSGPLLRVPPGHDAVVVRSLRPITVAAVGHRLYALDAPGRRWSEERLLVSSDLGRSWARARIGRGNGAA
ncbi:hypothetical protein [Nocardioides sp. T2.26MG-1]|uniref:hypothetical protein n=1 Tax=Nocardioides sp. T2.26MG-1 TaxID=3041166 RepID=UPI0024777BB7|nr:hypothetical protein [Nocardioides sp. T2.26MG-1]CAI9404396.1 hypothetical protein HIDPHFAB_04170 [Nocardioides sp. T2.26MG-1]